MFRQTHYASKQENNKYPEMSKWISVKAGGKTFCQNMPYKTITTWEYGN